MSDDALRFKEDLFAYLCQNVYLHIYSIGDLDDFFWPHTRWFVQRDGSAIDALALLYTGQSLPTLLALTDELERMTVLLHRIERDLPATLYAHLSPGLQSCFEAHFDVQAHGEHLKMGLRDAALVEGHDGATIGQLSRMDVEEIATFYKQSYPGNWFDSRMLDTGQYYGLREEGELLSIAGIHVYSPHYRVAALGNIATRPDCRGRGLARRVTAAACRSLREKADHIGLNVKADNQAAIACYRALGFEPVATYGEFSLSRRL